MADRQQTTRRLPPWLKKRLVAGEEAGHVGRILRELGLATVCRAAHCPNENECFSRRTATFMILGETCTRACRFCAISEQDPGPVRADEPAAVAEAAGRLGLRHVVVTSVTRDDLPDGGAGHFARTILAIRQRLPEATIEVLVPDFRGSRDALAAVLAAGPDVLNHNVETVPRLYAQVRPRADYARSLEMLAAAKQIAHTAGGARLFTKSGLMVGLGESDAEVEQVLRDLRGADCDIVTIGQYLAPSPEHFPVRRFVEPGAFERLEALARELGFRAVAAGPFVRSSYHAAEVFRRGKDA